MNHNRSMYIKGCRCEVCTAANADYQLARYHAKTAERKRRESIEANETIRELRNSCA